MRESVFRPAKTAPEWIWQADSAMAPESSTVNPAHARQLPIIPRLRRLIAGLSALVGQRVPVMLHHGTTRTGGAPASVLLTGRAFAPLYFSRRFFLETPQVENLGSARIWTLSRRLQELGTRADLTITCVDQHSARRFFGPEWLALPAWVAAEMVIPSATVLRKKISARTEQYKRHGIQVVESADAAELPEFHRCHYLPYVSSRHGELVSSRSFWKTRWRFRQEGRILWALKDGERVGGMVVLRLGDGLKLESLGVLDGRDDLLRQGVVSLLYARAFEHALEHGCRRVFFGNSRPSLHDGVLNFKRNWGAALCEAPTMPHDVLMRWNRLDGPVAEFLSHTSLVHRDRGALSALWAFPGGRPASQDEFDRHHAHIRSPGLHRMRVIGSGPLPAGLVLPSGVEWLDSHASELTGSFLNRILQSSL